MVKMSAAYKGALHCDVSHESSGSMIETDAPKDNQGLGEEFSPTDLVGAALASCILTTMGIVAKRDGVPLEGARADVEKEMVSTPTRRIGALRINVYLPKDMSADYRKKMEAVGLHCPVHKSLHPDVQISIVFSNEY